jgi:drug/metabolite transporter (DMT)-like permease
MSGTARPPAAAYAALLGAQAAVGSAAILARYGLDAGMSAAGLTAWRLTLAAGLVVAILRLGGKASGEALPAAVRLRLALAGVLLSVHFVAWFASLQHITVARSTLLVATSPLFAGIVSQALGRPMGKGSWLGLLVAGGGVWWFTRTVASGLGVHDPAGPCLGDLLAVVGAAAVAGYMLLVEDLQRAQGTGRVVAWTYSTAAAATWLFLPLLPSAGGLLPQAPLAWLSVLGMAALPQLVGHTTMNWCLRHFPAGVVGAATLLEPVFAAALAWPVFQEPITPARAAAGLVVLAGVWLAIRSPRRA